MDKETIETLVKDFKTAYSHKYTLESDEPLGEGAAGVVFKAHDINRDLPVVVKIYHDGIVPEGSERGWNLSSKTINKQIAPTYTIEPFRSLDADCKAVISRFIPGKPLSKIFTWCNDLDEKKKELVADDLVNTFLPSLFDVLELCHSLGFGHGDLHEGNVMVFLSDIRSKFEFSAVLIDFDNSSILLEVLAKNEQEKIAKDCRLLCSRLGPYIIMDWKWKAEVEPVFAFYNNVRDLRVTFQILLPFIKAIEDGKFGESNITEALARCMPYAMNRYATKGLLDALRAISKKNGVEVLFEDTLKKYTEDLKAQTNWSEDFTIIEDGSDKASLYKSFFK